MIKTLLDHGADIHLKNKADGGTAIHAASDHNQIAIVEMLIEHGADVNVQNLDGATPLIRAAINGYTELVEKLVSLGANAELVAKNGKEWLTAKVFAYRHGRKDRYNNLLECAHQVIVDRLTLPGHWPDV
jgi:ankyrin repeat protein